MSGKKFIDTNILVYSQAEDEPLKRKIASTILKEGIANDNLVISPQIIGEFYTVVTQKIQTPLLPKKAKTIIELLKQANIEIVDIDYNLVVEAIELSIKNKLSYWDSLVVVTASAAECDMLLSEDLSSGQTIKGVRIFNPFS